MSDIKTYNNYPIQQFPSMKARDNSQLIIEAHTSDNMKVQRPKLNPNDIAITLPNPKAFSDREATKKMQAINTDIYEGAKKEKEKHEFNLKRYLTIFGIIAIITAALAYFRKGK